MASRNRQTIVLSLATAVVSGTTACGPRFDPATARAQFSSKALSRPGMVARQPEAPAAAPANLPESAPETATPQTAPSTDPPSQPSTPQPAAAVAAAPATTPDATAPNLDQFAQRVLRRAADDQWSALRAHAIEAAIRSPALLRELAPKALRDQNRGVRFVACMAIAEARLEGLADSIAPLLADESPSVRAAAMLALARGGERVNFSPLASMLEENDPEVRANVYLVLGELGNESAIPMIRESLGRGMKRVNPLRVRLVDLAAAEALVKLGDEAEVEPIRAALFAPPEQGELTVVACDSVRRLRDEVARPMLERLVLASGQSARGPEIRLAAARALASLGSSPIPMAVASELIGHPDARVRAQVASLLGELRSPEAATMLGRLLEDRNPTVQIAAAGGIESQP